MISQDVSITAGGSAMPGYLARPEENSGPHPAVIILGDVFGFTAEVKRIAELVAGIGYAGLAIAYSRSEPSLSEPYTEQGSAKAFATAARVTAQDVLDDVTAAVAWLHSQPYIRGGEIAVWGFGFGATAALVAAAMPQLSGGVCFYPTNSTAPMGGREAPISRASAVACPLLILFGEEDYYLSRFDMDRITGALRQAGKDFQVQIYPGVGHSFFRYGRPEAVVEQKRYSDAAVANAVADSWNLVRKFLQDAFSRSRSHAGAIDDSHTTRTPQPQS